RWSQTYTVEKRYPRAQDLAAIGFGRASAPTLDRELAIPSGIVEIAQRYPAEPYPDAHSSPQSAGSNWREYLRSNRASCYAGGTSSARRGRPPADNQNRQ